MDKDKHKAKELRQVRVGAHNVDVLYALSENALNVAGIVIGGIAAAVMSDPTTYTEAILGKPNQEYVEWISKPDKWGGKLQSELLHATSNSNNRYCIQTCLSDVAIFIASCLRGIAFI